jgi:hypothetical protein
MKISKVIKLLKELKRHIGGDPELLTGDDRPLKEDDFSVVVRHDKSDNIFYSAHIKGGKVMTSVDDEPLNKHEFYDDEISHIETDYVLHRIKLKTPGEGDEPGNHEEIVLGIDDIAALANQLGFDLVLS